MLNSQPTPVKRGSLAHTLKIIKKGRPNPASPEAQVTQSLRKEKAATEEKVFHNFNAAALRKGKSLINRAVFQEFFESLNCSILLEQRK